MDRRARLLSPASTPQGVLLFLIGFWFVVSAAAAPLWSLVGPEAQLFSRVNELRRERHLEPLRAHPALAKVALAHANEMARNDYLSHVNLGGEDPLARVRAAGIEGFKIASSAAAGYRISAVIEEWLRSPSHRENLLNPAFNTTGLGVVETPDGHTLVVELFATF